MAAAVNHTDHADDGWVRFVVNGVRIPIKQDAAQETADYEMLLWRTCDLKNASSSASRNPAAAEGDRAAYQSKASSISRRASARTRSDDT